MRVLKQINTALLLLGLVISCAHAASIPLTPQQMAQIKSGLCPTDTHPSYPLKPWCGCKIATAEEQALLQALAALSPNASDKTKMKTVKSERDNVNFKDMEHALNTAAAHCRDRSKNTATLGLSPTDAAQQSDLDKRYGNRMDKWADACRYARGTFNNPVKGSNPDRADQKQSVQHCITHFTQLFFNPNNDATWSGPPLD